MSDYAGATAGAERPARPAGRYGVGMSLDWDSPLTPVRLGVELPFWLLTLDREQAVTVGSVTSTVVIENDGVEIQRGHQFLRAHRTTVFIGNAEAVKSSRMPVGALPEGGLVRATRTLLFIDAFAAQSAVDGFFSGKGALYQDSSRYLTTLAMGHLVVVNKLINAYRRASVDPNAFEVTAWDVPVWFLWHEENFAAVYLQTGNLDDWYPTMRSGMKGEEIPLFAAKPGGIDEQLQRDEIPGEIEILDGWSLYFRGRYADSIRSFVTSIEVLVEAEIRRLLLASGIEEEEIENRLQGTRQNFDERFKDYCRISTRRIPGPILHSVPYINGIRLKAELKELRNLRHRIVHHGERLDHQLQKTMQRAAEITSWLFDWIVEDGNFEARRSKNSPYFFLTYATTTFGHCEERDGKLVVRQPAYVAEPADAVEAMNLVFGEVIYTEESFLCKLNARSEEGKDIEHFTKVVFCELGLGEISDTPFSEIDGPTVERFQFEYQGRKIGVYLLDCSEELTIEQVNELAAVLGPREGDYAELTRAVMVVNDEKDRRWQERNVELEPAVEAAAVGHGISIMKTPAAARLILATLANKWKKEAVLNAIVNGLPEKATPPASRLLGKVYHFWERPRVMGITPGEGATVAVGNLIAVELRQRWHQSEVLETQTDAEGRITIKIDLDRATVPIGARVYRLDRENSFEPEPKEEEGGGVSELADILRNHVSPTVVEGDEARD